MVWFGRAIAICEAERAAQREAAEKRRRLARTQLTPLRSKNFDKALQIHPIRKHVDECGDEKERNVGMGVSYAAVREHLRADELMMKVDQSQLSDEEGRPRYFEIRLASPDCPSNRSGYADDFNRQALVSSEKLRDETQASVFWNVDCESYVRVRSGVLKRLLRSALCGFRAPSVRPICGPQLYSTKKATAESAQTVSQNQG
jgi:hypothetical protein